MRFTDSRDPKGSGILALRHDHFDLQGYALDERACILGVRIQERMSGGEWLGEYFATSDRDIGDLNCAFLWSKDTREINGFAFAWPAIVTRTKDVVLSGTAPNLPGFVDPEAPIVKTGPGLDKIGKKCGVLSRSSMLPVYSDAMDRDSRYERLRYPRPNEDGVPLWPKFPIGWYGIGLAGSLEAEQRNMLMSTDPRMIAVNAAGDPDMGSYVCDLRPDFTVDPERIASLQSMMRVVKRPKDVCVVLGTKNMISWNIGLSGCGDVLGGLVTRNDAHAHVSHDFSGFLEVGSPIDDKHKIGHDPDGMAINAAHVSTFAYFFKDRKLDAPLKFEGENDAYLNEGAKDMRVYLEYTEEDKDNPTHPFVCGDRKGIWRWRARCMGEVVEEPKKKDEPERVRDPYSPAKRPTPKPPPTGTPDGGGGTAPQPPGPPGPTVVTPPSGPPDTYPPQPDFPRPGDPGFPLPATPPPDGGTPVPPAPPPIPPGGFGPDPLMPEGGLYG